MHKPPVQSPAQATDTSHHVLIGGLFALIAFVVYYLTLSRGPFPGVSAQLLAQHAGLDPLPALANPVWGVLVRFVDGLGVSTLAFKMNLLSAVFGAGSVWLIYLITAGIPHNRTSEEVEIQFPRRRIAMISGGTAALALAFCTPFWIVSTRAHPLAFDVFILLFAIYLVMRFHATRRIGFLVMAALLFGVGMIESESFVIVAPFALGFSLYSLWRGDQLNARVVGIGAFCFLLGYSLYLVLAWRLWNSPEAEWIELQHYFQAIWVYWREHYRMLTRTISQLGWLMIFLIVILPWIIVIAVPKRVLEQRPSVVGSYLLHGVLLLLGIAILFNFALAPWPLLGPRLLVTPYALVAVWFGYLAGYWYILTSRRRRSMAESAAAALLALHRAVVPILAALLIWAAVRNLETADGRLGEPVHRFARETAEQLRGHDWLISGGAIDPNILLAAHDRGMDLTLLNPASGRVAAYQLYVASLFESPRLKGLAHVGLAPLVHEWLTTDPDAHDRMAVLVNPDIWVASGFDPIPSVTLFVAGSDDRPPDPQALMDEHRRFWRELQDVAGVRAPRRHFIEPYLAWIRAHAAKVANNLGVWMEDAGQTDFAFEAYQEARRLDRDNVSALLNGVYLAARMDLPEAGAWQAELDQWLARRRQPLVLWSLGHHFGYVRSPEAYADRGWAWAMSGRAQASLREIQRAAQLADDQPTLQNVLISLYVAQDRFDEGAAILQERLKGNPRDRGALLGMVRLSADRGDFDSARGYLGRFREAGASDLQADMEEAFLEILSGNILRAKELLMALAKADPDNVRVWAALALIASQDADRPLAERAMDRLQKAGAVDADVFYAMAQVHVMQNQYDIAQMYLDRILRANPQHLLAQEMMLRLDMYYSRRDQAQRRVEAILHQDSRHAFANYVLGTIQYARGDYLLAESSFRVSLEEAPGREAAINLAWVLQHRGAHAEALEYAQKAVEWGPTHSAAWHTLGLVLIRLNRLDEAEKALQEALSLNPENLYAHCYMGFLYERRGFKDQAIELLDEVLQKSSLLMPELVDEVRDVLTRLRREG